MQRLSNVDLDVPYVRGMGVTDFWRMAGTWSGLYEARGRENGHEVEDWFRAKEEIAINKFRAATA